MIVYDVATKVLDTESFGLISGITFVCSVRRSLYGGRKEINTHKHTHECTILLKRLKVMKKQISPRCQRHKFSQNL